MFNTAKFIREVSKRPAIWTKDENGKDMEKKMEDWFDLCEIMFKREGYNDLSIREKYEKKQILQRKWKNLKDSFVRDLRNERLGLARTKKRYVFYNHLKFLLPLYRDQYPTQVKIAEQDNDYQGNNDEYSSSGSDEPLSKTKLNLNLANLKREVPDDNSNDRFESDDHHNNMTNNSDFDTKPKAKRKRVKSNSRDSSDNLVDAASLTQSKQEIDANKLFLLSLLPLIENLSREHNLQARIELLQVLQKYQEEEQEIKIDQDLENI